MYHNLQFQPDNLRRIYNYSYMKKKNSFSLLCPEPANRILSDQVFIFSTATCIILAWLEMP